jgi:hypothetical protein
LRRGLARLAGASSGATYPATHAIRAGYFGQFQQTWHNQKLENTNNL